MFICCGLYINYQLSRLATALSGPGLLFASLGEDVFPFPENGFLLPEDTPGTSGPVAPGGESPPGFENDPGGSPSDPAAPPLETAPGDGGAAPGKHAAEFNPNLTETLQDKLDHPPDKKDLLKAGLIILRKLDKEEIGYLYQVGARGSCTKEELQHIREILLGALSQQEISTLKEIGAKYGKQLRILDAGVQLQ